MICETKPCLVVGAPQTPNYQLTMAPLPGSSMPETLRDKY